MEDANGQKQKEKQEGGILRLKNEGSLCFLKEIK